MDMLRRAARRVGRRGAFLAFLALLDVILGYGLTQPLPLGLSPRTIYGPMLDIAPLSWWAWWWIGTGLLCAVAAAVYRARVAAYTAAAVIKTAWAACYLIGWRERLPLFGRGYQTFTIFAAFAGIVLLVSGWRENGR